MDELSTEEKAVNHDTLLHIQEVQCFINLVIRELLERADEHDQSKLQSPEIEAFLEHTHKLSGLIYGSAEYNSILKQMKPALDHHYAVNRHHPEHFKNGISDMNLIDLIEMLCDWKASSLRQNDGNLRKSIEVNAARFNISPQLSKILENTADFFDQ